MKTKSKPIILLINDHNLNTEYVQLLENDYKVIQSRPSIIITNIAIELSPSLIILEGNDYGFHLCKEFKSSFATKDIPIIFSIADVTAFAPSKALLAGAIDYILEEIATELIKLKIDNYIHVYQSIKALKYQANTAKELNPNTGLPGNNAIISNIYHALEYTKDSVVVYVDLDNFKAYNDQYGFGRGDLIIKLTCDIITAQLDAIEEFTFLGHIGGDDFVFIAPRKKISEITDTIINEFDKEVIRFYSSDAQENRCITTTSRNGKRVTFPIMTISMGGVELCHHNSKTRFERISDLCSEVKKLAKSKPYSCYCVDKRNTKPRANHSPLLKGIETVIKL